MKIVKKRIINPRRYLNALNPGDKLYIATPLSDHDIGTLKRYGLIPGAGARIPIPHGSQTAKNADGYWVSLKHLPKIKKTIEHAYHLTDYQGNDIYGVSYYSRMCYQCEFCSPAEVCFSIEDGVIYSSILENTAESMYCIKTAMNVMLEMLGRCEIWASNKMPVAPPIAIQEVPWEILRAGTHNRHEWEAHIQGMIQRRPKAHQSVILKRHEQLWELSPDFCVLGTQNFWGYVVYGFLKHNLFVFESNQINNASYVFKGEWEAVSKLTKTEILTGNLHEARVFHTDNWYSHIRNVILIPHQEVA